MKNKKRILVKLSGQAMAGSDGFGICSKKIESFASSLKQAQESDVQVACVLGGGNFYRGAQLEKSGLTRVTGDHIGMLGTVMNCLALRDVLDKQGVDAVVQSAIPLSGLCEHYNRHRAIDDLEKGKVVLFAAGTGNPLFTTDTSASLRAIEIQADMLIKATQVDGVYDKDPQKFKDAKLFKEVTYQSVIDQRLNVMDLSAFCQCQEFNIHLVICNILQENALADILNNKPVGTKITCELSQKD